MIRGRVAFLCGISLTTLGLAGGCGSDNFLPPPKEGLRPTTTQVVPSTPTQSREIAVILPGETNTEIETWESFIRKDAGELRLGYRLLRPEPTDPPAKQAELIAQAGKTSSALIVVTNGSPETTAALAAVSESKKPIILLGRALPNSPESAKVKATLVTYEGFETSAKKMVAAVVTEAKKTVAAKAKPPLECLITRTRIKDESNDIRGAALEKAATEAGLKIVGKVEFAGDTTDLNKQIEAPLKAHPNVSVILSDDETTLTGLTYGLPSAPDPESIEARTKREPERREPPFKIAGYSSGRHAVTLARSGQVSAATDRNISGLALKAALAARDAMDGKTVGPKIEVTMPTQIAPNAAPDPVKP